MNHSMLRECTPARRDGQTIALPLCDVLAQNCQMMSHSRRSRDLVRTSSIGFHGEYLWRERYSDWGQLIWASRGAISVMVGQSLWLVPARSGLWLPPATTHDVRMIGRGVLRLVFIARARARALPKTPAVRALTPLLREILRRVLARDTLTTADPRDGRLLGVLVDELSEVSPAPFDLPMPTDPRAIRAAALVREHPAQPPDAITIARHAGASVRTLERVFRAETGLAFGAWRLRARLMHAMILLANGESVTRTGIAAGFAGTSAFVHAFRRTTGTTPGAYATPGVRSRTSPVSSQTGVPSSTGAEIKNARG